MKKGDEAVRQRYALGTGQKLACGGQVEPVKAAPVKAAPPSVSYQKYGSGYRKIRG